jgi:predicted porin
MKKIRLLAATAAALATQAYAAPDSVVEMYGTLLPFLDDAQTTGATTTVPSGKPTMLGTAAYTGVNDPSRTRISVGTTNWGFRGYEQINSDTRLVWQLESAFQIDQNTGPGLGGRNSKVGFASEKWGEVNMGQWDTPYKFIGLAMNPLRGGYVFDYTPIMGNPGMGVPATTTQPGRAGAKPDAAFDKRIGNVVQYWSPKWSGFSFRVAYQANEGTGVIATGGGIARPDIWSANAIWDVGSLSLRYAFEQHRDYFGLSVLGGGAAGTATNTASKDTGNKFVAIWKYGGFRVAGAYEMLKYHNDDTVAGHVSEYKRNAYYLLLEQSWGPHVIWGSFSQAADGDCSVVGGAACVSSGLGASYYAAGYIYHFSKRTDGYVTYYQLNNKESGQYSVQPLVGTAASIAPGADIKAFGVGLLHIF